MRYRVELKPRAIKDLKTLNATDQIRLLRRIEDLENNLTGDVKRLTNFTPDFRLRVGRFRILFEVNGRPSDNLSRASPERCVQLVYDQTSS